MSAVSSTRHLAVGYWLTPVLAWISWLNMAVLLGTLSLALFNASKDKTARIFAYVYALISIGVLVSVLCRELPFRR